MNRHPNSRMRFLSRLGAVSLLSFGLIATAAFAPAAASPGATPNGSAGGAYVALGDSFTSGQGAAPWTGGTCLRSETASYPTITANTSSYRSAINVACSAANTGDIAGQIAMVDPRVRSKASLVTLTVGGIDAGSTEIFFACSQGQEACLQALAVAQNDLPNVLGSLAVTYRAVADAFPKARIFVLTYPLLFDGAYPDAVLASGVNGATVALNGAIGSAVALANHPRVFLSDVTDEFAGRGIGAVGSFISFDPFNLADPQNFHPNAAGNAAYAAALRADGAVRGR